MVDKETEKNLPDLKVLIRQKKSMVKLIQMKKTKVQLLIKLKILNKKEKMIDQKVVSKIDLCLD